MYSEQVSQMFTC